MILTLELNDIGIKPEIIDALLNINFTKFGHLSYKAMNKILPHLEEGLQYDKATELAGYNLKQIVRSRSIFWYLKKLYINRQKKDWESFKRLPSLFRYIL